MSTLRYGFISPYSTFKIQNTIKSSFQDLLSLNGKDKDLPVPPSRVAKRYMFLSLCTFAAQLTVYILSKMDKFDVDDTFEFGTLDLVGLSAVVSISYVVLVIKTHNIKIFNVKITGNHWKDWTIASILAQVSSIIQMKSFQGTILCWCHV